MEKIAAVILAAGKGTRMTPLRSKSYEGQDEGQSSPIPKVMFKIHNRPMIEYSIENMKNAGIDKVVLVVGYQKEMVMEEVGDKVEYAIQEEQLGTGHAAMQARKNLEGNVEAVIVCYGDMPLFKPDTIKNLIKEYNEQKPTIAMLSAVFENPEYWAYGRISRDQNGYVEAIIEQKDCNEEQLKIKESNPGFYIFDAKWLWENFGKLSTNNAQHEYYLTDMIKIAKEQGKKIIAVKVSEENEVLGINNQEQLKKVEEILKK
jgi:bifunctional UDP-N-acetylglucosamine pyrophosphorylase/glucosamine-1-phosphate N-acetyltransferase